MSIKSRLVASLFAAATIASSALVAGPVSAASPLPSCAYRDVGTAAQAYDQYPYTLLDTTFAVKRSYAPRDVRATDVAGGGQLRAVAIKDLRAMFAAARTAGAALSIKSSYRSFSTQVATFKYWVGVDGYKKALLTSARAGHSEHQLGTVVDITSLNGKAPWDYADWGKTKPGAWMRVNSWVYGFVLSYPKGPSPSMTCYKYEPWRTSGSSARRRPRPSTCPVFTTREWFWSHPRGMDERLPHATLEAWHRARRDRHGRAHVLWRHLRPARRRSRVERPCAGSHGSRTRSCRPGPAG